MMQTHLQVDRDLLLQIAEQLSAISQQIEQLALETSTQSTGKSKRSPFSFDRSPTKDHTEENSLLGAIRPPLPDPRLIRKIVRFRQLRADFFNGELFADPAWDMLLDLAAARAEHIRVSVTSLCIASGVPLTTALRWIANMVEEGHFVRLEDEGDRRRAFIALSDEAAAAMARYFASIDRQAAPI